jgi:hypothetical protein
MGGGFDPSAAWEVMGDGEKQNAGKLLDEGAGKSVKTINHLPHTSTRCGPWWSRREWGGFLVGGDGFDPSEGWEVLGMVKNK